MSHCPNCKAFFVPNSGVRFCAACSAPLPQQQQPFGGTGVASSGIEGQPSVIAVAPAPAAAAVGSHAMAAPMGYYAAPPMHQQPMQHPSAPPPPYGAVSPPANVFGAARVAPAPAAAAAASGPGGGGGGVQVFGAPIGSPVAGPSALLFGAPPPAHFASASLPGYGCMPAEPYLPCQETGCQELAAWRCPHSFTEEHSLYCLQRVCLTHLCPKSANFAICADCERIRLFIEQVTALGDTPSRDPLFRRTARKRADGSLKRHWEATQQEMDRDRALVHAAFLRHERPVPYHVIKKELLKEIQYTAVERQLQATLMEDSCTCCFGFCVCCPEI